MNVTLSKSEHYRCSRVEVMAVPKELATWKREMKLMWHTGESFSTSGLALLLITAYLFPKWRRNDQSRVWMQMCLATQCFIYVYVHRDFAKCKSPFIVFAAIYLGQVAFCWMLAGAWLAKKRLVTVFKDFDSGFMVKATLFSWVTPLPCDLLRIALDTIEFPDILFTERRVDIIIGAWRISPERIRRFVYFMKDVGMYLPVFVMITLSVAVYAYVLANLWRTKSSIRNRQEIYGMAGITFLFVLMSGVQFLFVIINRFYTFTRWDLLLAFLVTFQVFVNSVLFVFGIKSSRDMWVKYVKDKYRRIRDT